MVVAERTVSPNEIFVPRRPANLSGEEEIGRLEEAGIEVTDLAKKCLKSESYKNDHNLAEGGSSLKMLLVSDHELCDLYSFSSMREYAGGIGCIKQVPATVALRMREEVSIMQQISGGFWNILVIHTPISIAGDTNEYLFSLLFTDSKAQLSTCKVKEAGEEVRMRRAGRVFAICDNR